MKRKTTDPHIFGWTGKPTPCTTCGRVRTRGVEMRRFNSRISRLFRGTTIHVFWDAIRFCRRSCLESRVTAMHLAGWDGTYQGVPLKVSHRGR